MPDFRGPCQSLFLGPLRKPGCSAASHATLRFTKDYMASMALSISLASDLTSFFISFLACSIASSKLADSRLSDHDQGSLALL